MAQFVGSADGVAEPDGVAEIQEEGVAQGSIGVAVGRSVGTTVGEGVTVTVGEGEAVSVGNGSVALGEPSLGSGLASVGVDVGVETGVGLAEVAGLVGDFVGSLEDV